MVINWCWCWREAFYGTRSGSGAGGAEVATQPCARHQSQPAVELVVLFGRRRRGADRRAGRATCSTPRPGSPVAAVEGLRCGGGGRHRQQSRRLLAGYIIGIVEAVAATLLSPGYQLAATFADDAGDPADPSARPVRRAEAGRSDTWAIRRARYRLRRASRPALLFALALALYSRPSRSGTETGLSSPPRCGLRSVAIGVNR